MPTWAAQTYAASRSRTAARMPTERSLPSTMLSCQKNGVSGSIFAVSFGLCSSMVHGPRMLPYTFCTASATAWCSAGRSSLLVIGATRGMPDPLLRSDVAALDDLGPALDLAADLLVERVGLATDDS